jgi:hypothetical protein
MAVSTKEPKFDTKEEMRGNPHPKGGKKKKSRLSLLSEFSQKGKLKGKVKGGERHKWRIVVPTQ